jgi:protein arginine kinase
MKQQGTAPETDVVISSRIRLARNSENFPFPTKLDIDQAIKLVEFYKATVFETKKSLSKELSFIDSTKIKPLEKACLVEKHLISPEFAAKKEVTGLILSKDEKISIMINEEDHLRIQSIFAGFQLNQAWELCSSIDDLIESESEYAYSKDYGYLTCCPTNVGTGMRASVMVHLPALTMGGYLSVVLDAVSKLGIAVRGLYGEGSDIMGNMYQISNQVSLGQSEEEIITKINIVANRIIEQERLAREQLLKSRMQLEDRVFRSYGIFSNARVMTSSECMKLISDVRLGVDLGIINDVTPDIINELVIRTQPANLQKHYNTVLNPEERDIKRAEFIREKLIR